MSKRLGFTLIELLVALAIMGLLLAVGTIGFGKSKKRQELRHAAIQVSDIIERTRQYALAPRKAATGQVCAYSYRIYADAGSLRWRIREFMPKSGASCATLEALNGPPTTEVTLGDNAIEIENDQMGSDAIKVSTDKWSVWDYFYTYKTENISPEEYNVAAGESLHAKRYGTYTITVKYAGMEQKLQVNPSGSVEWL